MFNKNNPKLETPKWASFFKGNEYEEFIKSVENYFYSKNITYKLGDGLINAGPNDFGLSTLGLANVAQVCKQGGINNYQKIVKEHFDALIRTNLFNAEFRKTVADYDKIKEYIGVRLYPSDYAPPTGKDLTIGKAFAGDIYAMLIFDLPDSLESILPEQAGNWGKTLDELFEIGVQNIKRKYPLNISMQQFGELKIWFVQSNHFFAPNIVFDLENLEKLAGSYGLLIGIPHRHAVIIYPIENIEVINAINTLVPVVYGMNQEGPGSVSNNIFWYKDGHYENLPYEIADGKIQFYPPENFIQLLNNLGLAK